MREKLGEYYKNRVWVSAIFSRFGRTKEKRNVVCFRDVRIDGQPCAGHVWTHRSGMMRKAELQPGDLVLFEAEVGRYLRSGDLTLQAPEYDFTLEKIRNFSVTRRAKG